MRTKGTYPGSSSSSSEPTSTPMAEFIADYLEHLRNVKSLSSARIDTWYVREIFGLHPGRVSGVWTRCVEDITTADISRFFDRKLSERSYAPKTLNRFREILCRMFNWGIRQRGMRFPRDINPASVVERFRERAHEIRFLLADDVGVQLDALADLPKLQAMVAVLIFAGLRRSELLWLTPRDVNLDAGRNGVLYVRSKTVNGDVWQPKTARNRSVPISMALRPYLDSYGASASSDSPWYFPTPNGMRYDPDNFSQVLRKANRAQGLIWSCLDYRHTFGSHLAMKGESLYKISTLMGNSPEICRRHYAALMLDSLYDSVEFPFTPCGHQKKEDLQLLQVL